MGQECYSILTEAGIRIHALVGAFYIFLDFTPLADKLSKYGITGSRTLCERLLEEKQVALVPGECFGRPAEELTARLAYVNFDGVKALVASENIPLDQKLPEDFTHRWCEDAIVGTQRIADWVSGF